MRSLQTNEFASNSVLHEQVNTNIALNSTFAVTEFINLLANSVSYHKYHIHESYEHLISKSYFLQYYHR